jgi:hypothetical protein
MSAVDCASLCWCGMSAVDCASLCWCGMSAADCASLTLSSAAWGVTVCACAGTLATQATHGHPARSGSAFLHHQAPAGSSGRVSLRGSPFVLRRGQVRGNTHVLIQMCCSAWNYLSLMSCDGWCESHADSIACCPRAVSRLANVPFWCHAAVQIQLICPLSAHLHQSVRHVLSAKHSRTPTYSQLQTMVCCSCSGQHPPTQQRAVTRVNRASMWLLVPRRRHRSQSSSSSTEPRCAQPAGNQQSAQPFRQLHHLFAHVFQLLCPAAMMCAHTHTHKPWHTARDLLSHSVRRGTALHMIRLFTHTSINMSANAQ